MSTRPPIHRTRPVVATWASGLTLCLTALTAGVAPAPASPHDDPATPTTTAAAAPEPEPSVIPEAIAPSVPTAPPTPTALPDATPTPDATAGPEQVGTPIPTTHPPTPEAVPPRATELPAAEPSTPSEPAPTPVVRAPAPKQPAIAKAPPATAPAAPTPKPARTTGRTTAAADSSAPGHSEPDETRSAAIEPASGAVPASSAAVPPSTAETSETAESAETVEAVESAGAAEPVAATAESGAPVTPAAQSVAAIETSHPQTLQATPADVALAKAAPPVEQKPAAPPQRDLVALASSVRTFDRHDTPARQWDRDWVRYDEYYRPILSNPYRDPVRIVYVYQNSPRVAVIPPLASIVLDALQLAVYSFTAIVVNAVNTVVNVAVGSFFGAGYVPVLGRALPPPPAPILRYDNVPIQVRYHDAVYQPFRVQRILDVGDDVRYGERKVLLDGVTPAWGRWVQTPSGERQFEVHKTQQYPGLDDPRQVPLPGDYRMTLVSDDGAAAPDQRGAYLAAAALACAGLSVAALIGSALMGRRRAP